MFYYTISLIIIYIFFGLLLFLFQRRIVFNVSGKSLSPYSFGLKDTSEVKIVTKDGIKLLAWYSAPQTNKPTLLYFHGNSFDIGERAYRIKKYIDEGWGILLLAWRGYSGNAGKPTEKNLYIDAESSLEWIANQTTIKKNSLVVYGESLGAAIAIEMGTRYEFKSIVLEAPFTSIYDIALKRYKIFPFKFLVLDKFDNFGKINKIKSPILIISGTKDEIVPHNHSIKLFKESSFPKDCLFVDDAMHNNLYDFGIDKKVINFNNLI